MSDFMNIEHEMGNYGGGVLQLIIGPMFAGKTTELLRRVRKYKIARKKCFLIKYDKDCRYDTAKVMTHDKLVIFFSLVFRLGENGHPTSTLMNLTSMVDSYDVIAVDEGQFYSDLIKFAEYCANRGKVVIIAALDGDFRREPFGQVCQLIPKAESVVKLKAVCMFCQKDAVFTCRITKETQTEVIGGSDKYMACCRKCYMTNPLSKKTGKRKIENVSFSPKKVRFIDISESIDLNL